MSTTRSSPPSGGWSTVDLHVHTTASDGRLTPAEMVALALRRDLQVLSITDHDSTEGVAPAIDAAAGTGLEVIPGVEINTDAPHGEAHVLGYFIDHEAPALQRRLVDRRRARFERGYTMVERLRALSIDVSWDRVQDIAGASEGGAVGRPHVALAMQERGYVTTIQEAFERYLGRGGPAYVEYEKLTPEQAVAMIREAGGLAALAHPGAVENLAGQLAPLVECGLAGLECYYGTYSPDVVARLLRVARQLALVPTGGSDYHGTEETTVNASLGATPVPLSAVDALRARWLRDRPAIVPATV